MKTKGSSRGKGNAGMKPLRLVEAPRPTKKELVRREAFGTKTSMAEIMNRPVGR